jgi:hypothetical protein
MRRYFCPYLKAEVELGHEREQHIIERHPDLVPDHLTLIAETLADPDLVRKSARFGNARLFSRWYSDRRGGKYIVVVVVTDSTAGQHHWVITAYMTSRLVGEDIEWKKG